MQKCPRSGRREAHFLLLGLAGSWSAGMPGKPAEKIVFLLTNVAVKPAEWEPPDLESQQTPAVDGPHKSENVAFVFEVHTYSYGSHS